MHTYEVVKDWWLQEQGVQLEVGVQFVDGDLDPDVIAQLLSSGIIEDLDAPVVDEPEPVIVEPDVEPEPEDETPARRGRGR